MTATGRWLRRPWGCPRSHIWEAPPSSATTRCRQRGFRHLLSSPCSGSGKCLNREEELLPLGAELSGLALPCHSLETTICDRMRPCRQRDAESTVRLEPSAEELRPIPPSRDMRLTCTSCTIALHWSLRFCWNSGSEKPCNRSRLGDQSRVSL